MASYGGPDIVNDGLIFGYDTGQPVFSNNINTRLYLGRPTTNISSGIGMSTYNNVPGNVSSVLEGTTETFQGAQVIKQTLTPADASGVSYLSNGNNPGIGVVTGGGGGLANRYTGHSIFFKPTVPMHSSPIFTSYSNIGGWQSSNLYEAVGNGWFRAYVTWYNTITQSDGKYWAINPLQAVLNQPIVIYWAGPFKEDLNSQAVSPYVYSSRSNTGALIDADRVSTIDLSRISFNSSTNAMFFDGSDDTISVANNSFINVAGDITLELVLKRNSGQGVPIHKEVQYTIQIRSNGAITYADSSLWSYATFGDHGTAVTPNVYHHIVATKSASTVTIYVNNNVVVSRSFGSPITQTNNTLYMGSYDGSGGFFNGEIPISRIYNRALSASEISQNFQTYRRRFGI